MLTNLGGYDLKNTSSQFNDLIGISYNYLFFISLIHEIDKIIELSSITMINNQIELERIKDGLELGKTIIDNIK